jgi:hypothetical protein
MSEEIKDVLNSGLSPAEQSVVMAKVYQAVAHSMAIAIQDATDNLRNINSINATAMGVAMAQFLKTKDPVYVQAVEVAMKATLDAANAFSVTNTNAIGVLKNFPAEV